MSAITRNGWRSLRAFTDARIASGRAGNGLPTAAHLGFQLDHARARDAVHLPLDVAALQPALQTLGHASVLVNSEAPDRRVYLQRPDLGRRLSPVDEQVLREHASQADIAITIADGLSARAVQEHALPLLAELLPALSAEGFSVAPLVIALQGRVAIGDAVGAALAARLSLVLIGERPGLSSPDSLGIYLTYDPRPGKVDAERNCISNIRPPQGLGYAQARDTCLYLCRNALRRGLSGVGLKDDSMTLEQGGADAARIPFLRDA